jgi:two-component system response regulator FixJ
MSATVEPQVYLVDADGDAHSLLEAAGFYPARFASGPEFLEAWAHEHGPIRCLVLDVSAAGQDGRDLLQTLHDMQVPIPLVVAAHQPSVAVVVRALKLGALTVLERPIRDAELLAAVQEALALYERGQKLLHERQRAAQAMSDLTPRESQVFELMAAGTPNREIAEQLGISPKTLDIHRANVMEKMKARTPADLARAQILTRAEPRILPFLFP